MAALTKKPPSVAPWPPATADKKAVTVSSKEGLGDIAQKHGMTLKEFLLFNFQIDMDKDKSWAFYVNWYLQEKLRCVRLTAGGNYMFSGGETLYVPQGKTLPKPKAAPLYDMTTERGVKRWFVETIMPLRTVGRGHLGHNIARLISGEAEATPNGMCGEAAFFVQQKFLEATTGDPDSQENPKVDGYVLGQVLWNGIDTAKSLMPPNHTAAILCPDFGIKIFNKNLLNTATVDITPQRTGTYSYEILKNLPVLDLYRIELTTLDLWWKNCSWFGWGRISIDSTRFRDTIEG